MILEVPDDSRFDLWTATKIALIQHMLSIHNRKITHKAIAKMMGIDRTTLSRLIWSHAELQCFRRPDLVRIKRIGNEKWKLYDINPLLWKIKRLPGMPEDE